MLANEIVNSEVQRHRQLVSFEVFRIAEALALIPEDLKPAPLALLPKTRRLTNIGARR